MTVLLHIDASARKNRSISRKMGEEFRFKWLSTRPDDKFIYRDIGSEPPEFISESWIAASFTPEEKRTDEQISLLKPSDLLIKELSEASIIVISTPMYNYGMPASMKAWIDQVIRVNKTFSFDLKRGDFPLEATMKGKSLILLTSCGEFGFEEGGIRAEMNHLAPHFHTVSKYLGVDETHEIRIEYQEFGDERHEHNPLRMLIKQFLKSLKRLEQKCLRKTKSHLLIGFAYKNFLISYDWSTLDRLLCCVVCSITKQSINQLFNR